MLRFLPPQIAGIWSASYFELSNIRWELLLVFIIVASLICFVNFKNDYWRLLIGLAIYLSFFCLGLSLLKNNQSLPKDHWTHFSETTHLYRARVDRVLPKENHIQFILSILEIKGDSGGLKKASGRALVMVKSATKKNLPQPGNFIAFRAAFKNIQGRMNPGAFDAAFYWQQKEIQKQAWIKDHEFIVLNSPPALSLTSLRKRTLRLLKKTLNEKESLGVAIALIIGDKSHLDKKTKKAFIESGAIHVLAVSGLHVGLIYGIGLWILKTINRWIFISPFVRTITLILWLVFYALFTGAGPSVCRSVLMMAAWTVNSSLYKTPSIINIISVSAFILLLWQPILIFDVGFQLSYAAVLGIIFVFPSISIIWLPKNKIVKYGWQLICISISAQIGTLPISLYYFHQFPTYFILSGLVIIPIITLALVLGIISLAVSSNDGLLNLFGNILDLLINICIEWALFIQKLPCAILKGIWIEKWEVFTYYLILILLVYAVKKQLFICYSLITFLILLCVCVHTGCFINNLNSSRFIIYHTPGYFLADRYNQGKLLSISPVETNKEKLEFYTQNFRARLAILSHKDLILNKSGTPSDTALCISFENEDYLLIRATNRCVPKGVSADHSLHLIVNPINPYTEYWLNRLEISSVILLNHFKGAENWRRLLGEKQIPYWDIREKGAYIKIEK